MKCFVIMPFGNPEIDAEQARRLESIYSDWIKPAVESVKGLCDERIDCHRADKELRPEEIISHLIDCLVTSDIVVADLTGKNANVFYELGVRHAVSNNTILIAESMDDIPFDLRGLRIIIYSYEPGSMLRLKASLEQAILEILREPEKIDNPVRRFLYNREVDKLSKQPVPGYDVFKDVISEIAALKNEVNSQVNEVRRIVEMITSPPKDNLVGESKVGLEFFEGIWRNERTKSLYFARIIEGELLIPYSFHADREITGHYYNLKLIGDTLLGRFQWFEMDQISGYLFLKIESENKLTGGWWYSHDVPAEIQSDISLINTLTSGMVESTLERVPNIHHYPKRAEEYFADKLKHSHLH